MFEVPIGKARTVREGEDITIITYGTMVNVVEKALEKKPGISAEVLDLRTINPLDEDAIVDAAKKTGKVIIVHEAPMSFGVGAEVSAIIADKAIYEIDAPITRITSPSLPYPMPGYENYYLPNEKRVIEAIERLLEM